MPAGLAGHHDDGALERLADGAAHVVGVGGVQHHQLDPVGGADDLRRQRGAAHAAQHDAVEAAVGEDVTQADDLVDQRPRLLRQTDPGEALARLVLGGAAPQGRVAPGDPRGHSVGDQGLDSTGVRRLVAVAEEQLEPVGGGSAPVGHLAASRFFSTVSRSSFHDFTNFSTPSSSRVLMTSS